MPTNQRKVALVTGATGQDGVCMCKSMPTKGDEANDTKRHASLFNTHRMVHTYKDSQVDDQRFKMYADDFAGSPKLIHIAQSVQPEVADNLAAMSNGAVRFEMPEYNAHDDGIGTLHVPDVVRVLGPEKKTHFYQASTSQLFGLEQETPHACNSACASSSNGLPSQLGITVVVKGQGLKEIGIATKIEVNQARRTEGSLLTKVGPCYFRPSEVESLLGDPTKARDKLGWVPRTSFEELVREMVLSDFAAAKRDSMVKLAGFRAYDYHE